MGEISGRAQREQGAARGEDKLEETLKGLGEKRAGQKLVQGQDDGRRRRRGQERSEREKRTRDGQGVGLGCGLW